MDINQFIQQSIEGNAVQAKETLDTLLSGRAFEALDAKKQEIAKTLYGNGEDIEVQDTADSEIEEDDLLTQEEVEELDEVSQKTAVKAYSARLGREDDDTGNTKSMKTMDRIHKKYGAKGVMRAATAADKEHGIHSSDYTKKDFVGDYLSSKK